MYQAVIPVIIDVRAETPAEARVEAHKIAEQLGVLPSARVAGNAIRIYDEDGVLLYPTPPCIRCGDETAEERYLFEEGRGLCNYCAHVVNKEVDRG